MKYRGKILLLDNFREVLKDYSMDVQDVVRSAILDGVDVSEYLEACRYNPDRLNQIRLGMKENIPAVYYSVTKADSLYCIRKLLKKGKPLSWLEKRIAHGGMSDEGLSTLVEWIDKDYNIEGIDVSIIPMSMLESFEYGLSKGFNMSAFNNGRQYPSEYVRMCLALEENGRDYKPFISKKLYDLPVLKSLVGYSKSADDDKWGKLISVLNADIPEGKVKKLIQCVNNSIPIGELAKPEWSESCIELILLAFSEGVDYRELMAVGPDTHNVSVKCNELFWKKSKEKRVGGILRKG